jgi:hypothetical protein
MYSQGFANSIDDCNASIQYQYLSGSNRLVNTTLVDTDNDGITDNLECQFCTDANNPDTDNDGIPDGVEDLNHNGQIDSGETGACDKDSDDDGISDGDEDINKNGIKDINETDPRLADTDADGIQDGTESGYTFSMISEDTDKSIFIPDSDPQNQTNPLKADSDDDGIPDGDEDVNHNGSVDSGESDPNDSEIVIHLSKGWNWVTFNIQTNQMGVNDILPQQSNGKYLKIVGQYGYAEFDNNNGWFGSLNTLSPDQMYMLKMDDAFKLRLRGARLNASTYQITVRKGWNWTGYLLNETISIEKALESIAFNVERIVGQQGYAESLNGSFYGSLQHFAPNQGYKVKMSVADSLSYNPSLRSSGFIQNQNLLKRNKTIQSQWSLHPNDFEYQGNVTAIVLKDGRSIADTGDILAAFHDGVCRGISSPVDIPGRQKQFFLQVWSNSNTDKMVLKYFDTSEKMIYTIPGNVEFVSNMEKGSISNPEIISIPGFLNDVICVLKMLSNHHDDDSIMNVSGDEKMSMDDVLSILKTISTDNEQTD